MKTHFYEPKIAFIQLNHIIIADICTYAAHLSKKKFFFLKLSEFRAVSMSHKNVMFVGILNMQSLLKFRSIFCLFISMFGANQIIRQYIYFEMLYRVSLAVQTKACFRLLTLFLCRSGAPI